MSEHTTFNVVCLPANLAGGLFQSSTILTAKALGIQQLAYELVEVAPSGGFCGELYKVG